MLPWAKEEGKGDPLLLLLVRLVWLNLRAAAEAEELLSSPAFIFPSSVSQSGWREAGGAELSPPQAHRDLLWLEQVAALPFFGSICCTHSGHFSQTCKHLLGSFVFLCGFLYVFCMLQLCLAHSLYSTTSSDGLYLALAGQPAVLLNVRQVALKKEAARSNMSLMLCRWEQNNFTMKLVR